MWQNKRLTTDKSLMLSMTNTDWAFQNYSSCWLIKDQQSNVWQELHIIWRKGGLLEVATTVNLLLIQWNELRIFSGKKRQILKSQAASSIWPPECHSVEVHWHDCLGLYGLRLSYIISFQDSNHILYNSLTSTTSTPLHSEADTYRDPDTSPLTSLSFLSFSSLASSNSLKLSAIKFSSCHLPPLLKPCIPTLTPLTNVIKLPPSDPSWKNPALTWTTWITSDPTYHCFQKFWSAPLSPSSDSVWTQHRFTKYETDCGGRFCIFI